jgi:hypothetical protein
MKTLEAMVCGALLCWAHPLFAQPGPPPGDQRPFQRIEQWKKVRLIETLGLNEEQSARFIARLNEHDAARRSLFKERMDALDRLERLVQNHASEKELVEVFPEVTAVDDKIIQEDRKFFNGLSEILSPEQRAKYLLFERHFERELREAMREVQQRRHREESQ